MAGETDTPPVTAGEGLDRQTLETRLDELVRNNRFTIAVVFPVTGAVLLLASAWGLLPDPFAFNPALIIMGVLVMRLPLLAGIAPQVGRRAGAALLALGVYAYGIEFVGLQTGWPYGEFAYGVALGPMLLDELPLFLPVFFFPLVVNGYLLCLLLLGDRASNWWVRLPAVIAAVVAMDLALDPGSVALGFWSYAGAGSFYGVPLSNFGGWVLSATVSVALLDWGFDRTGLLERLEGCEFMLDDLVSFVILWGGVNAAFENWLPAAVALLFGVGLVVTDRFDVPTRPR